MNIRSKNIALLFSCVLLSISCVDKYLPDSLDAFDRDVNFTTKLYRPQLGKNTLMSDNFSSGNSTLPLTFEISRIVRADGSPAPELTEYFPVKVWKTPYMGTEKSIEEIEAKREIEYRTLFQVKKHSGEFMMWSNAESSFVQCAPSDGYIFDVLVKNSGGYKTFTDMQLIPVRESDYEPSIYDPETGLVQGQDYVTPNSLTLFQTESGDYMFPEDVHIYFRENQDNDDDVKSLTFRFYVKYDVVYPMPLVEMKSKYTNKDGNRINVNFLYDRITASGYRMTSTMSFEFAIYKEAHWEIIVVFTAGAPLFEDGK